VTDNDFAFEAPTPPSPPGTYPAIITNVEAVTLDTVQGPNQPLVRWTLTFTDEDGEDHEVDALSGRNVTPRSKAGRWLTAIGKMPTDGKPMAPASIKGSPCLAVIGTNEEGYQTLEDIVAPPKGRTK
jgi:hypothetical protein